MARRLGNVAPHDVHTTPQPLGLPMEEREDRETVRARMEAKRAQRAARSPFARPAGDAGTRLRTAPDEALAEQKFASPDLDAPRPPAVARPEPTTAELRAFAAEAGLPCAPYGRVPKAIRRAWDEVDGVASALAGEGPAPDVVEAAVATVRAAARECGLAAADAPPPTLADASVSVLRDTVRGIEAQGAELTNQINELTASVTEHAADPKTHEHDDAGAPRPGRWFRIPDDELIAAATDLATALGEYREVAVKAAADRIRTQASAIRLMTERLRPTSTEGATS